MRNLLKSLSSVLILASMCVFFSCRPKPITPTPPTPPTPSPSIVGTWEHEVPNYHCCLTLNENGTFMFEEFDEPNEAAKFTGKYTYSNGYLKLYDSTDKDLNGEFKVISLTETELVLKDFFEDRENSTFTKKEETPKVSIIGTWKYSWGENEYLQLTFSGSETQGTIKYEEFENGDYDNETGSYTYSNSYLSLPEFESEKIEVVSLTESELVLRDFPDEGNCTFHKQ